MATWIHCERCNRNTTLRAKNMCSKCYWHDHYQRNKQHLIARGVQYYRDNKVNMAPRRRNHYQNNRERLLKQVKKYQEEHKEQITIRSRKYRQNSRPKRRVDNARYRARKHNAFINDFTAADWELVLEHYKHRCAYCSTDGPLEQEHIVPLSRGGPHTSSNIAPACQSCNSRKGARIPSEAKMYLWVLPLTTVHSMDVSGHNVQQGGKVNHG